MNKEYLKPELIWIRLGMTDIMADLINISSDLDYIPEEDETPLVPAG